MYPRLAPQLLKSDPLNEYKWIDFASGPLSEFIEAVWIYGGPDAQLTQQVLVPHWKTCVAVVREWKTGDHIASNVRFLLLGPVGTTQYNQPNPGTEIIAARLHPEAVGRLTSFPLADLCDQDVQWSGASQYTNLQRIAETTRSPLLVASALVEALLDLHRVSEQPAQTTHMTASLIRHDQGRASINSIARRLDCSARTIRRQFMVDFGVSPKRYARLVRLKATLFNADLQDDPNWAGLAHEFGYADQAHMLHDVRDLTGYKLSELHAMRRTPCLPTQKAAHR